MQLAVVESGKARPLRAFAAVAMCLVAVLALYFPTFVEMTSVWSRSETFTHGWLVLPAFLYFTWQRRVALAALPMKPFAPALLIAAGAGFVWLVGELSNALTPSFFATIALVPLVITVVFGWRWTVELAFPLAFLFFAVPFGEVFVPTLVEWTADFTVAAVRASGVPVFREGPNFVVPSGRWSVVEACSGIRYLLASMFVGSLYAWQVYRSPVRRAFFFAASIVVPVVANWVRAYLIVMLGHMTDNKLAGGVDHLIYGWVFFGVVMLLMFAVGSIWREDAEPSAVPQFRSLKALAPFSDGRGLSNGRRVVGAAGLMAIVLLTWPAARAVMMRPRADLAILPLAIDSSAGWQGVRQPLTSWRPHLQAASKEEHFTFEKNGRRVGLFVGIYRNQRQGAELVNSVNTLLPEGRQDGVRVAVQSRRTELGRSPVTVREEHLRLGAREIIAWQWYWLGEVSTSSDTRAKLELAMDRLVGRDDASAWVTAYVADPERPANGYQLLDEFVREMGEPIGRALRKAVHP